MFTRPADLSDETVASTVAAAWRARTGSIRRIEYAAVGFGSYHWHAWGDQRWFVTVDDLAVGRSQFGDSATDVARRLTVALGSARALRDAGLEFVVAPIPTIDGEVVRVVHGRWAVAVYPFVEGHTRQWGAFETAAERRAVVQLLATLHLRFAPALDHARRDDFTIPSRRELHGALVDRAAAWTAGPYGESAHQLVRRHAGLLEDRFARYDRLAASAADQPERMVLTHGEPHAANTIDTTDGVVLIDWDTALIAPPERDLWWFAGEEPACLGHYLACTGVEPRPEILELYRLRWDLTEVSLFVAMFHAPHTDNADTRVAWEGLRHSLEALRDPT